MKEILWLRYNVTFFSHLCSLLARDKIEIKPGAVRGMCCPLSLSLSLGLISAWHFMTLRDASWHSRLVTVIKTKFEKRAFEMLIWNVTTWYHTKKWENVERRMNIFDAYPFPKLVDCEKRQRLDQLQWFPSWAIRDERSRGWGNGFPIIDTNDIITHININTQNT